MEPIICTEPMDMVHTDYVSMEVTMGVKEKPVVKNVLVIKDHLYVTPRHTSQTIILHTRWHMYCTTSSSRYLGSLNN